MVIPTTINNFTVANIGSNVFQGDPNLFSITFLGGISNIEDNAFAYQTNAGPRYHGLGLP